MSILIVLALAIGLALGALNGLLIWLCDVPPIVVTLGTLSIFRGATYVLSGGAWVNANQMSPSFIGFQRTIIPRSRSATGARNLSKSMQANARK